VPKRAVVLKTKNGNYSEDINFTRHVKQYFYADKDKIQKILTAVLNLLREYPTGIKSTDLNRLISEKINCPFSHKDLNCNSELEFIKKYVQPDTEIEILS